MAEQHNIDFSKPLKDRMQEDIALALAAHLAVDRPDTPHKDLLIAARKIITEQEAHQYYEE